MTERGNIRADLRELFQHLAPHRRRQLAGVLAAMLAGGVAELLTIGSVVPFLALLAGATAWEQFTWLARLFELLGATAPDQRLVAATLIFMASALIAAAIRLHLTWASQKFVAEIGHDLSVEIQRRVLLQPYIFHAGRNSSEIVASIEQVQIVVSGVLAQLMHATTAALLSLFIAAALVQVDVVPAIVAAIAFAAIYGALSYFVRGRLRNASSVLGTAHEQRIRLTQESASGIREIILDQTQAAHLQAFRNIDRRLTAARTSTIFLMAAPRLVAEAAGIVLIAALALTLSGRQGGLAPALPVLGAIALGAQRLLPLVQQLYHSWGSIEANRSLLGRVLTLLRLPVEERESADSLPPIKLKEAIVFDGVSFTYPGRKTALTDLSLTIPAGCRLAVVGRTGSGKSTFADLLMGLIEPSEGQILIDGRPLDGETRPSWQRNIAHVPQMIFLADASIAHNIAFAAASGEIDLARVERAAEAAELASFIDELPDGYATVVGERGIRLSGGQRQRLAIARAVYKDAPVLVLDEATSALDYDTEQAVLHALDRLARDNRTVIVIAHRESTIARCDLLARLDGGRLVELAPART